MAISVDWPTKVITIPQDYLIPIIGTLYDLDTDQFRLDLKNLEDDSAEGMVWPDTHRHSTVVTVAGVTYARVIEIINGYRLSSWTASTPYAWRGRTITSSTWRTAF